LRVALTLAELQGFSNLIADDVYAVLTLEGSLGASFPGEALGRALAGEVFGEKEAQVPGLRTMKRDLGVLISSPSAQVFYHLDVPLVSLWQIRGVKTVWAYPVEDPYVGAEALEAIVLRETAEQFAFDPAWDAGAAKVQLTPGRMLTWPQNAPHRIENGPMLNVSLSIEFMTAPAVMRANVLYANGVLRKRGATFPGGRRQAWTDHISLSQPPAALKPHTHTHTPTRSHTKYFRFIEIYMMTYTFA